MTRIHSSLLSLAIVFASQAARAAEGGHGGAEGGGGLLQTLGIQWQGLLVQICGFVLLFLILRKFLFGPLQGALATRRTEIQETYDRLDEQQRSLDARRQELEARIIGIEAEARDRITQAANEAKALQEQMLADARDQATRIVEDGRRLIQMEQEKALATLREEMATLAVRAAGQLIAENLNEERHRRLVSDFIQQVGS